MSFSFKNLYLFSEEIVTCKTDKAIQNEILHSFNRMVRNKHSKVFRILQFLVLTRIIYCRFFVYPNHHSGMKSLNVNHFADYSLVFLLIFNPVFIGVFT